MRIGYRSKQIILLVGDTLGFILGFFLSMTVRNFSPPSLDLIVIHAPLFSIMFLFWFVFNYISGLYDLEHVSQNTKYYRRFSETAIISLIVSIVFFYLIPNQKIAPKTILFLNILFGYGFSFVFRFLYIQYVGAKRLQANIIFVGYTQEVRELMNIMKSQPEKGYNAVALIDPEKRVRSTDFPGVEVFEGLHTIRPAITNYHANLIVIAPHLRQDESALRELYQLLFWKVEITDLPSFYETITGRIPPSTFSESWFLEHLRHTEKLIYDKVRRLLDYVAALLIGLFFIIIFPFVALLIKLSSRGPLFFKQKRIGYNGRMFEMYKFRSMYALAPDGSAEVEGWEFAKKKDKRITAVGGFLRKTRIDELPQVWNLWRGDITLIGPRPERPAIVSELEERMPYYPLRHLVRPGLTGWAVLHQQYTDTIETSLQKLQYDLYYIKNRSFLLDLSILLRTVNVVLRLMGQ